MRICVLIIIELALYEGSLFLPTKYCTKPDAKDCEKNVEVYVNSLYSPREFVTLNYSYSGFCANVGEKKVSNNIGQKLFGDSLYLSKYLFEFNKNLTCQPVCSVTRNEKDLDNMRFAISNSFQHEWFIDDLPVLRCISNKDTDKKCAVHFYFGCVNSEDQNVPRCEPKFANIKSEFVIFNHLHFDITYHTLHEEPGKPERAEIIKIEITPNSLQDCNKPAEFLTFKSEDKKLDITFTYSVKFIMDNTLTYNNRFDYFYKMNESGQVKLMGISISIILVVSLSTVCAYFMIRAVRSDISRYTEVINSGFEAQDEYGWKLLKGDIFRAPKYRLFLSISVGNGVQILFMILFTLLFSILGFYSSLARGSIVTCLIVLYVLLSSLSGFLSARIYKFFDGEHWKMCVLASALLHPGIIFFGLVFINVIVAIFSSGGTIPFLTLFELFALWAFISIPLTFAGALYGFKRRAIKSPVKKNIIPRMIPRQTTYTKPLFSVLVGGFICFLCIYVKLYFIFQSIWLRHSYVMLGLLFFTIILMIIVCAEVAVMFCYMHLCAEDYRWQWRSFLTVSFCSFYCLVTYVFEFSNSNEISNLGKFISLGYSSIMLYMLTLATGSVGFTACFYVLLKMFSSIKVD